VVGVGSSAGGLAALQDLVAGLVPGSGAAFVIAQHQAPRLPSHLDELLSQRTALRVEPAADGSPLVADVILVAPPNCDVLITGDHVRLVEPGPTYGPSPNIDRMFTSVAAVWGGRGAGVLLSGSGSDGAQGLRDIRAADGLTFVQDPDTAAFDSMPRAAIGLEAADLICEPGQIGRRIAAWTAAVSGLDVGSASAPQPDGLAPVVSLLRRATGIDFSGYKETTLRRQVNRRIAMLQVSGIDEYVRVLASSSRESDALRGNLLVRVTSFFRDAEAFASLREHLRGYLSERDSASTVRIWVPGSATGEEAYSVAMVVADLLPDQDSVAQRIKVFATDLDDSGLVIARRGRYLAETASRIPPDLRQRFMVGTREWVEVVPALRECLVFARHNVAEDPPLPQIDLVSCRNTLMYFTPDQQHRVLASFRFSLLTGGLLFLGRSETAGSGYRPVDADHSLFARTAGPADPQRPASGFPQRRLTPRPELPAPAGVPGESGPDLALEDQVSLLTEVLRASRSCGLLLDDDHHLVLVVGDVGPYCRVPEGLPTTHGVSLLRPPLQAEARALLLLARAGGDVGPGRAVHVDDEGPDVTVGVRRLAVAGRRLFLLCLAAAPPASGIRPDPADRGATMDARLSALEGELLTTQESLRAAVADLEAANEELQASSEELAAATEELQASYEELETGNEELQATNDELSAVNRELHLRGNDLESLNDDLANVQNSSGQGLVLVDTELRITRFTPLSVRLFAMVDTDIGEPLLGVPTTIPLPGLEDALRDVTAGSPRESLEVRGPGVAYVLQVQPYRQPDGRPRGAIITMTDVTDVEAGR
jgi:two-component system CheB/CheR fusion protein